MIRQPVIEVRNVSRTFSGRAVLRDVSLRVAEGEVFALVGPNGTGKTTLIEILATLLHPSAGHAAVHGFDVVRKADAVRALIGYCPSHLHSFYPRLSGRRNLDFFAALAGLDGRQGRLRIDRLLDEVGLSDAGSVRVERYSDGMRARLAVARVLLADARVLLLDEPTKSLDPEGKARMRDLLLRQTPAGPRTILWVTHDRDELARLPGPVGQLEDGVIRERRDAVGLSA